MADGASAADAQSYREAMRSKAERLGGGEDAVNVDASDFTPAEKLYAGVKTGMRPVSRQARKSGGKVMGMHAGGNPGRSPRKGGGNVGASYVNRDSKAADAEREGHYPNGGMRRGGRTHKAGGGLGMFGGLLPMAIDAMSGGDKDKDDDALGPTAAAAGKARGGRTGRAEGGYLPREGGSSATRGLKTKTGSSAVETGDRPASEDGRLGRASGGRVAKQGGGPLATPLAAGMGGQGRLGFNFGPQQSMGSRLGISTGGRAVARARYGRAPGGRVARADGGKVEKKVLAAHHAEHEAMREGKADGGSIRDEVRTEAKKGGHGPDCGCPRCTARKAKGGLLKEFDAKKRAEGGRTARAKGGKAGTKINIVIAPGGANPQPAAPPPGMGPPGAGPIRPPGVPMPMPGGPPAGAAPPMPMPIPVPMGGGAPGAPPMPPPRKRGGRAPKVGSQPRAGGGSGLGRLQKTHAVSGGVAHEP